jgi:peptidase E
VGLGGSGSPDETRALLAYVAGLAASSSPRVCVVPTASGDDPSVAESLRELFPAATRVSSLSFFPWPPDDLRDFALAQDVIFVGGGNTANMLAIWRVHGFDEILREAWQAGVVLAGWSAGMICWFEAGVTDSFGPQLAGMRDGLAFLPGSACPHYDGEELRRPVYRRLVTEGFPAGYAADDCAGLHFVGAELAEVVSAREGAAAYRVEAAGEAPLPGRTIAG